MGPAPYHRVVHTALLLTQLLLAAVFGVAGVGKLRDLEGSRGAMEEFGVPVRLTAAAGIALPIAELTVAMALLFPPSARWGAIGALALLLAFIAGIASALSQGRAPDCHCFGQIYSAPAGASTLVRNGLLAALSLFAVVFGPAPSITGWAAERSAWAVLVTGAAVAAAVLAALRLRSWWQRRSLERALYRASLPSGLPVGTPAPVFDLPRLAGDRGSLDSLRARGKPVVLFFTHPQCGPCHELLPSLARWHSSLAQQLTIALVSQGDVAANEEAYEEHELIDVLLQEEREVYEAYEMRGTPSAVVVSPDGQIASATAEGDLPIEELLRQTLRRSNETPPAGTLSGPSEAARAAAANLRVDHAAASVLQAFEAAGVRSVLLKGASIARWLYAGGEPRAYIDVDLLVAPPDLEAARDVLASLGYVPSLDAAAMPEWWQEHATGWLNAEDNAIVDLHRTLQGVGADPDRAWAILTERTDRLAVAGFAAPVLPIPGRALYLVLHAAHHGPWAGPQRDLELALAHVDDDTWRQAAALAEALDATPAFASGLSLLPDGAALASRLGLATDASIELALRRNGARPQAVTMDRLARAPGAGRRLTIVARKLFPPPTFMRSWSALADRGPLGLGLAYALRPLWVIAQTPPAVLAWLRARTEAGRRTG